MKKLLILSTALIISASAFAKDEPKAHMGASNQKNNGAMLANAINKDSDSNIGVRIEAPINAGAATQEERSSSNSGSSIEMYGLIDLNVGGSKLDVKRNK